MKNLVVIKIVAGQVEVYALNPEIITAVVVDTNQENYYQIKKADGSYVVVCPGEVDQPVQYPNRGSANFKARKLDLSDYTIEEIKNPPVIELAQALTRLSVEELESIRALFVEVKE